MFLYHFSYFFLSFGVVKDDGCILCALVIPLHIKSCRIMKCEKEPHKLLVTHFGRIKTQMKDFNMASRTRANLAVSGILRCICFCTHKPYSLSQYHSRIHLLKIDRKVLLSPPVTPSPKRGQFFSFNPQKCIISRPLIPKPLGFLFFAAKKDSL